MNRQRWASDMMIVPRISLALVALSLGVVPAVAQSPTQPPSAGLNPLPDWAASEARYDGAPSDPLKPRTAEPKYAETKYADDAYARERQALAERASSDAQKSASGNAALTAATAETNKINPAIHNSAVAGRIGAMPVASERVTRQGAAPLPLGDKWQHVVTTIDCPPPPDMRDFSPQPPPQDDLWDDYHEKNDRWWAELEYLRWRVRGYDVPPLVTQSPAGTAPALAGRLPAAAILAGDEAFANDFRNGGRARLGWWAVDGQFVGYQAEYFGLEDEHNNFSASAGPNDPILARPFFNTAIGVQDATLLNGPGLTIDLGSGPFTYDVSGSIDVATSSDIHSFAITRKHVLWTDFERNIRTDWLFGYRYFRLAEEIMITDTVRLDNPSGGLIAPGTLIRRIDDFDATNDFHGGEVGLSGEIHRGRWSLNMLGKLGIGSTHQQLDIRGNTAVNPGGALSFVPSPGLGGFLAQPDLNIGSRSRDAFTLLPEAELGVSFQVNDYVRLNMGASMVYINRVVRPGSQIDSALNPTFFPGGTPTGAAAPSARFDESYLLMYGFNGGVEVTW